MGLEAHFFGLENISTDFSASSNGTPLLARPFFNIGLNAQDAMLIASPAVGPGQVSASETTRFLGAGIAFRKQLCDACALGPVAGLIGYRYLHLRDALGVSSTTNFVQLGATFAVTDQFETRNDFHGLDLGLAGHMVSGPWRFEWLTKVALGATLTNIEVNGATTITTGGIATAFPEDCWRCRRTWVTSTRTDFPSCPSLARASVINFRRNFAPSSVTISYTGPGWCVPAVSSTPP